MRGREATECVQSQPAGSQRWSQSLSPAHLTFLPCRHGCNAAPSRSSSPLRSSGPTRWAPSKRHGCVPAVCSGHSPGPHCCPLPPVPWLKASARKPPCSEPQDPPPPPTTFLHTPERTSVRDLSRSLLCPHRLRQGRAHKGAQRAYAE